MHGRRDRMGSDPPRPSAALDPLSQHLLQLLVVRRRLAETQPPAWAIRQLGFLRRCQNATVGCFGREVAALTPPRFLQRRSATWRPQAREDLADTRLRQSCSVYLKPHYKKGVDSDTALLSIRNDKRGIQSGLPSGDAAEPYAERCS